MLIEHAGPWGRDGLLDARLPAGLGRDLRALERRTGARVLLIRKTDRLPEYEDDTPICFAVDTRDAWLGFTAIERIEDAARLDPRDRGTFPGDPGGEPLFVVCTHGRRDPCCAERGRPLAEAAAAVDRDVTWESTHVGGDRFAGNLVAFPHGLTFGRVEPDEASELMHAYHGGRIAPLPKYRGRTSDGFSVQTADRAVRDRFALDRIDDLARIPAGPGQVGFATPLGRVTVRLERGVGTPMRLTCHAVREEAMPAWRVLAIDVQDGDR